MTWKLATLAQLYQILYDEPCEMSIKLEAKAEIKRRKKIKYRRINWREKEIS